jgi:D-alanine-D-alanine ligase
MNKINKHIEIVCSTAPGLSSMSQPSRQSIATVLDKYYSSVGITLVNNMEDLERLARSKPDLVFLGMKFIPSNPSLGMHDPNKIWLTQFLDEHDIAYTGSGQIAHALELDKSLAKQNVLQAGLKTSAFHVARKNHIPSKDEFVQKYPLFIKPTDRGAGVGIDSYSVVRSFAQLVSKVESISTLLGSDSLIEEYLDGREFSVAILKDEFSSSYSVMPLELIAPADKNGARLLSSSVKTADSETFIEVTDPIIRKQLKQFALDIFRAIGARDYGRIDIRMNSSGVPHFLEANLIPSLLDGYGNFPKACMLNINMPYEAMILRITRLGLQRSEIVATAGEAVTPLARLVVV